MRTSIIVRVVLLTPVFAMATGAARAGVVVGAESRVPPDPRQEYARFVRFRPADGQVVTLNPPRFSWPYLPDIAPKGDTIPAGALFTLQISKSGDFAKPDIEVKDTPCNFYAFLPELKESKTWRWRVGYDVGKPNERWSDTRSFTLAADAVVWDRASLQTRLDAVSGHPRILFNGATRKRALDLQNADPYSGTLATHIVGVADKTLKAKWYVDFPRTDDKKMEYMPLGQGLVEVALAYLLTGDAKYAGFKERFLTMASWSKGGWSSPEGVRAGTDKWTTHLTEYFGLLYDWFYDDLTPAERDVARKGLEWRIDYTVNSFAWRAKEGTAMRVGSVAVQCSSHPFENLMVTIPGALAICDESPVARQALELGVRYIVSMTSGHGEDEAWNEGAGYGNGKMKWLMDATCYLQSAIPELQLGRNEMYSAYRDFFARLTPVGAQHCSFGNRAFNEQDWMGSRINNLRRVAMLRDDGVAMQNWIETHKRFATLGKGPVFPASSWVDYFMPLYGSLPEPVAEADPVKLFPLEGWVMASSAPPSDYEAQQNAVSMTFACRPRGGYSHAFRSENAFDIHAYGATVAVGGGTTSNQEFFANHTMSHNTVLVNGMEQLAAVDKNVRSCGRVIAFRRGDDFVYWAGDATPAYGPKTGLGRFVRHVVFVDGAWFVVYDDLAMRDSAKPANFQWLYHVAAPVPLDVDEKAVTLRYAVDETEVVVRHLANVADLSVTDLPGKQGMVNPVTGEDVTGTDKWLTNKEGEVVKDKKQPTSLGTHHVWIANRTPRSETTFLAVIAPYRKGEAAPTIEAAGPAGVRIAFRGKTKTVSFDKTAQADIVIDIAAVEGR